MLLKGVDGCVRSALCRACRQSTSFGGFARVGVGDHEMPERRKLGLRLQLDAAARQRDCLGELSGVERQLGEEQVALGEVGVAIDGRPERRALLA